MAKTKKPLTLGDQLKAAIAESGLTNYAIAKGAGINQATMQLFVTGTQDIRLETASKLADYLDLCFAKRSKASR